MRDSYKREKDISNKINVDSVISSIPVPAQTNKDVNFEEYNKAEKLKFSGIFTIILLIFISLSILNTELFTKYNRIKKQHVGDYSISKIVYFLFIYFSIGTLISLGVANTKLPALSLSLVILFIILSLTFLFHSILEKLNHKNFPAKRISYSSPDTEINVKNTFRVVNILPIIQFGLVSLINTGLLLIPAWTNLHLQNISIELLILQMLSSMLFIGFKATTIVKNNPGVLKLFNEKLLSELLIKNNVR